MLVHGDAHPPALPPDGASGTATTKDHHVFSRVAESLLLSHSPTAIRNCGPSNTYHDREPKNYWCPSLLSPAHTFVSYMNPLKSEHSFLLWAKLLLSVTTFLPAELPPRMNQATLVLQPFTAFGKADVLLLGTQKQTIPITCSVCAMRVRIIISHVSWYFRIIT